MKNTWFCVHKNSSWPEMSRQLACVVSRQCVKCRMEGSDEKSKADFPLSLSSFPQVG